MGYLMLLADCFLCKKLFTSNPDYVPSYQGEPVCEACMRQANLQRERLGLAPHPIHPDAYSPQEEH